MNRIGNISRVFLGLCLSVTLSGFAQSPTFGPPNGSASTSSSTPQAFNGPITAPEINGEIEVGGAAYTNLNSAWTAAVTLAGTLGFNQTIRLGPGSYPVTATLSEPTNGSCVNILGSGVSSSGAGIDSATNITVPSNLGGDVINLINASVTNRAEACTFRDFTILTNKNATHGFEMQWFRGLQIHNVTVNDTTSDGILLGSPTGSNQSNFDMRNVLVSYDSGKFTPASRPLYGINLTANAIDSVGDFIVVRNAQQAAILNLGGGNTFHLIHGFGFPYTCTTPPCNNTTETNPGAADASYATNFVVIDNGTGGNLYADTYIDSPAEAGFDLKTNGVQIVGGHIQWPETTSFPHANLAWAEATMTSNLAISDIDCLNMSTTSGAPSSPAGAGGVWISYFGTSGTPPNLSSVSNLVGCSNFWQSLNSENQAVFNAGGSSPNNAEGVGSKVLVYPLTGAANKAAYEAENFTGGLADQYLGGFAGQNSNYVVTAKGTLHSGGGLHTSVVAVTTTATLTYDSKNVLANASAGAFTITLPSCFTPMADGVTPGGMEITISKTDTTLNALTLATSSSETFNGLGSPASTFVLTAPSSYTFVCGTDFNWYPVATVAVKPRSTWTGTVGGLTYAATSNDVGTNTWQVGAGITATSLSVHVNGSISGCTTSPVLGVFDATSSSWIAFVTLANSTFSNYASASGTVAAGDKLTWGIKTAAVGCTIAGSTFWGTLEYTMQ
jgi:hypothetical protein